MKQKQSGSLTVEATFVMLTVLMAVFFCMFFTFFLYDQLLVQISADRAAERGAIYINNTNTDFAKGNMYEIYPSAGLYRRIIPDVSALNAPSNQYVSDYMTLSLTNKESSSGSVDVDFNGFCGHRLVNVKVAWDNTNPFASVMKVFNFEGTDEPIKAQASAVVQDPAEYIRNIDFAVDLWKKVTDD